MIGIKKIQVVPLDYNEGKIIDSAATTDDKTKNTYSMRIVDQKISDTEDYVDSQIGEVNQDINDLTNNVYAKGNFATVSASFTVSSGSEGGTTINYPTGFTKDNCFVIGYKIVEGSSSNKVTTGVKGQTSTYEISPNIYLSSSIYVNYSNNYPVNMTYSIEILLMKIS